MKKLFACLIVFSLLSGLAAGCSADTPATEAPAQTAPTTAIVPVETPTEALPVSDALITLSPEGITLDNIDPESVYTSHDIIYYEDRDTYESGYAYGEGTKQERHSAEEAAAHTVVNITAAGTYRLTGTLPLGQIRVDLGEEAAEDPDAVVTLILDNCHITCQVAPAILFKNVYECDNTWSTETATSQVDTSAAGANLILASGSQNIVTGSHVAKIYKDGGNEKKLWKQDGAIYSYMSMNVNGDKSATLDLTADNEGLDTELHLTILGGNINIRSHNDGINTNEDGVSVTTINGGNLHIIAGLGQEGDGIDSNGWLVINGGTVVSSANPAADAGLDSDMGSFVNGGTVVALGSTMDWAESESLQVTMNLQFAKYKNSGDAIVIKDTDGSVIFAYDPSEDEVLDENVRQYMGAVISSPAFQKEAVYEVFIGGTLTGEETAGIYSAVSAYDGGTQQAYTGTDVRMGPGGFGGFGGDFGGFGGGRPDGKGEPPQMPEGQGPQKQEGQPPQMPEGEPPQMPEGEMPGSFMPGGDNPFQGGADGAMTQFYMQDPVNCFSGIQDAE